MRIPEQEPVVVARVNGVVFKRHNDGREVAYRNGKPIGDIMPDGMSPGSGWFCRFDERPMPKYRGCRDRQLAREQIAAEDRLR